jgi:hypothetical protein
VLIPNPSYGAFGSYKCHRGILTWNTGLIQAQKGGIPAPPRGSQIRSEGRGKGWFMSSTPQKYAYKLQIWEIAQTGELFTQYDQYLERFVFHDLNSFGAIILTLYAQTRFLLFGTSPSTKSYNKSSVDPGC